MDSFSYVFGFVGFIIAMACLQELNKTKKILSKYVNDEDKRLLLTREKMGKRAYVFSAIWLLIAFAGIVITLLMK